MVCLFHRKEISMILTSASGRGGTGKTTIAINLALSLVSQQQNPKLPFLDCDAEEPNAHLFLKPVIARREEVNIMIPQVYEARCAEVCQYHAIAALPNMTLVLPELCHGCGGCTLECAEDAISEVAHPIGIIEEGQAGTIAFAHGTLNVGEPMATPIIRLLKRRISSHFDLAILDAPPGTACPVVESMKGADFVLMVTEPSPFGLHDLRLAVQVARDELGLPVLQKLAGVLRQAGGEVVDTASDYNGQIERGEDIISCIIYASKGDGAGSTGRGSRQTCGRYRPRGIVQ
jgi:MinD superfamily P-loop ATPase